MPARDCGLHAVDLCGEPRKNRAHQSAGHVAARRETKPGSACFGAARRAQFPCDFNAQPRHRGDSDRGWRNRGGRELSSIAAGCFPGGNTRPPGAVIGRDQRGPRAVWRPAEFRTAEEREESSATDRVRRAPHRRRCPTQGRSAHQVGGATRCLAGGRSRSVRSFRGRDGGIDPVSCPVQLRSTDAWTAQAACKGE